MFLKMYDKYFSMHWSANQMKIFKNIFENCLTNISQCIVLCDRMWQIGPSDPKGCCTIQMHSDDDRHHIDDDDHHHIADDDEEEEDFDDNDEDDDDDRWITIMTTMMVRCSKYENQNRRY